MSNEFYGQPAQLIGRGLARSMGEGWETARRRDDGNDWVEVSLACEGVVTLAELDTSYFLGNAPGQRRRSPGSARTARSRCCRAPGCSPTPGTASCWSRRPASSGCGSTSSPTAGMARLRLWGRPTPAGRSALGRRWFDALPDVQALEVLGSVGVPPQQAGRLVGARPVGGDLPPAVARLLDGPRLTRRTRGHGGSRVARVAPPSHQPRSCRAPAASPAGSPPRSSASGLTGCERRS